jgi:aldehyde dehydrogenase (NAD+)
VKYEPLGVALIMNAWNYPFMGAIQPLATAIGSGNMAIIKTSEVAKSSSKMIKKLVERYLDPKAFKVIEGDVEVSKDIITKQFDLVVFTGSSEKGKIVAAEAGKNLTPCILELGGKSPCIVDKSANLSYAADKIVFARFSNGGQTCVATDYVLVHEDVARDFKKAIISSLKNSFQGKSEKYLDSDKGSIINETHVERIKGYLTENHGGKVLFGVKNEDGLKDIKNNWIAPTIIEDPKAESAIMNEEIFGPILPITSFSSIRDAIREINSRPKPLAIYYFGSNFGGNGNVVRDNTSSGAFVQNEAGFQAVHPNLPFGGVGNSGYGSYHGEFGFKNFSHPKACLVRVPLNFYPFNAPTMPFTRLKEFTVKLFLQFGQIGQKKLIKRLIQLWILIWLIRGFATGTFQKKWRMYKPMVNLVWGMVKPKFLK